MKSSDSLNAKKFVLRFLSLPSFSPSSHKFAPIFSSPFAQVPRNTPPHARRVQLRKPGTDPVPWKTFGILFLRSFRLLGVLWAPQAARGWYLAKYFENFRIALSKCSYGPQQYFRHWCFSTSRATRCRMLDSVMNDMNSRKRISWMQVLDSFESLACGGSASFITVQLG